MPSVAPVHLFWWLVRGWVKMKPHRNWTAGLVHVATYQGSPFWGYPIFDPQPNGGLPSKLGPSTPQQLACVAVHEFEATGEDIFLHRALKHPAITPNGFFRIDPESVHWGGLIPM